MYFGHIHCFPCPKEFSPPLPILLTSPSNQVLPVNTPFIFVHLLFMKHFSQNILFFSLILECPCHHLFTIFKNCAKIWMALKCTILTFQVCPSVALNSHVVQSSSCTYWTFLLPKQSSTPAKQCLTDPGSPHSVLGLCDCYYSTLHVNIRSVFIIYHWLMSFIVSFRSYRCCG